METQLYHHGILGQKWGIRRFQNADGSLTAEGKKRYTKSLQKAVESKNRLSSDLNFNNKVLGIKRHGKRLESENKNYIDVMNRISKEAKPAKKEEAALKDAYEKLKVAGSSDEAMKAYDNYVEARGSYNTAMTKFLDKYADDILGARLKDLGDEDTKVGREILSQIVGKDTRSDWYLVPGVYEERYNFANSKYKHYEDDVR